LERETGLEPATFSLEGLDLYAEWRPSSKGVHFVSSYRVVVSTLRSGARSRRHETTPLREERNPDAARQLSQLSDPVSSRTG